MDGALLQVDTKLSNPSLPRDWTHYPYYGAENDARRLALRIRTDVSLARRADCSP